MNLFTLFRRCTLVLASLMPLACVALPGGDCEADGATYADGDEVPSGDCNSCACRDGEVVCTLIACPDPSEPEAGAPSPESCNVDGMSYPHGARGVPAPDGCNTCSCDDGELTTCTEKACAPTPEPTPAACGTRDAAECEDGFVCDISASGDCGATDRGGVCVPRPEACAQVFDPVCGCDGMTYSNSCTALSAGVSVASDGECESLEPDSCEVNGVIYPDGAAGVPAPDGCNTCSCDDGELTICTEKACAPTPEPIPAACGTRGATECEDGFVCDLSASGDCGATDRGGVCVPRPEVCPQVFAPVCGCDGMTYSNGCMALGAGVSVASEGACEEPPTEPEPASCKLNGETYPSGTGNIPAEDGCNTCFCNDGVLGCTKRACPVEKICGGLAGERCNPDEFCHYDVSAQCGILDASGVCRALMPDAQCLAVFAPVCGCDGKTYSNECVALTSGASILKAGACGSSSSKSCTGGDGLIYPDGATNVPAKDGCNICSCEKGKLASCTEKACNTDHCGGLTGLSCGAGEFCDYQGRNQACGAADQLGTCRLIPQACSQQFEPVCGCDDRTHGNSCVAASNGVGVLHDGRCE